MAQKVATRDAYGEALVELGRERKDIVVLDADLSKSTKTAGFAKIFPERFFNMGIAEANLMGTAAGLAAAGKVPFVSTFAVFAAGRAFDQVRNSIAYPHLNVKICATHAGITVGEDGASHQSIEDLALMRALPGMTVIVPADGPETKQAVRAAAAHNGPVYIRLGRSSVPVLFDADYEFTIGRAAVLRRGEDVALFACGILVAEALQAARQLAEKGIRAAVLNVSTLKPLDEEAVVALARQTGAVVTCEEHNIIGGLGSAVAEVLGEKCPVPLERVGVRDVFGQSGKPAELLEHYGLTAAHIAAAAERALARKAGRA
ncbi:transketolase family protein [Gelria sp. Kuro-4]|uniref:transketolase family protein n=1 Tax=Gelria sp. Kuro-4 TaxID=2796927 RepID=UPI001BEF561A|nr:transketolase family protein [Gelria sp. Kuro-4]BCV25470.1 transketolase [Gelria sp. Kuro-4]